MNITELYKRILTSVILLPVVVFLISTDKLYFNFYLQQESPSRLLSYIKNNYKYN